MLKLLLSKSLCLKKKKGNLAFRNNNNLRSQALKWFLKGVKCLLDSILYHAFWSWALILCPNAHTVPYSELQYVVVMQRSSCG